MENSGFDSSDSEEGHVAGYSEHRYKVFVQLRHYQLLKVTSCQRNYTGCNSYQCNSFALLKSCVIPEFNKHYSSFCSTWCNRSHAVAETYNR